MYVRRLITFEPLHSPTAADGMLDGSDPRHVTTQYRPGGIPVSNQVAASRAIGSRRLSHPWPRRNGHRHCTVDLVVSGAFSAQPLGARGSK